MYELLKTALGVKEWNTYMTQQVRQRPLKAHYTCLPAISMPKDANQFFECLQMQLGYSLSMNSSGMAMHCRWASCTDSKSAHLSQSKGFKRRSSLDSGIDFPGRVASFAAAAPAAASGKHTVDGSTSAASLASGEGADSALASCRLPMRAGVCPAPELCPTLQRREVGPGVPAVYRVVSSTMLWSLQYYLKS